MSEVGPRPLYRRNLILICHNFSFQFVSGRLYDMHAKFQSGEVTQETETGGMPLLQRMLHYRIFSASAQLTNDDVISEGIGHLYAFLIVLIFV